MSEKLNKLSLDELENAEKIIIGLSGGADSVALTHILFMRFGAEKLMCAHLNHGIRGKEAERDENFARSFAESLGIRFVTKTVNIPELTAERGIGSEECGREERYAFFNSLAAENDLIATAHNADDNAETVIMNLSRGCGLQGLSGIPARRENIVRPILPLTREEIEAYCSENSLSFVTDSTNLGNEYDRNIIRHQVIPALREINSAAVRNIFRSSENVREDEEYLNGLAEKLLAEANGDNGTLKTEKLISADLPVLRRAAFIFLSSKRAGRLERKHLELFIEAVKNAGAVNIPGGLFLNVKQGIITVTSTEDEDFPEARLSLGANPLPGGAVLMISEKKYSGSQKINNLLFNSSFVYDTINETLSYGPRKEGERLRPAGRGVSKSLKALFNEKKIPASLRNSYPVIRAGGKIVLVPGIAADEEFRLKSTADKYYFAEIIKANEEGKK